VRSERLFSPLLENGTNIVKGEKEWGQWGTVGAGYFNLKTRDACLVGAPGMREKGGSLIWYLGAEKGYVYEPTGRGVRRNYSIEGGRRGHTVNPERCPGL